MDPVAATGISETVADAFGLATTAINAWRGRLLNCFGRVEHVVTEALLVLASHDPDVELPHLLGQRFASLEKALERRGDAAAALSTLECFRRYEELRTFLAHGDAKITLDRSGKWHAVFTVLTLRTGSVERTMMIVDAGEAEGIARKMRAAGQRFEAALARLPCDRQPTCMPRVGSRPAFHATG